MRDSSTWDRGPGRARAGRRFNGFLFLSILLLSFLLFADPIRGQDIGSQEREYLGNGAVITVSVHDASGQPISSLASVRLFRGITPSGQHDTTRGVAEFVVTGFGEFTVVVTAAGYEEARKDITVDVTGRTQVDILLRPSFAAGGITGVPGKPLLAPKAKEALDKGLRALKENNLGDADKYVGKAMRMAPGNPDVLYIQGVLDLKEKNWKQAQAVLEKATQLDPDSAPPFAALGMALCDQGNYEAALVPLRKSLQLAPAGTWETQWALGKSYYHLQQYSEALTSSRVALEKSNGKAPEIALLVAQSFTAVGRYEDAAQVLRQFLMDHADRPDAATARRWLDQLKATGHIRSN
jgi:Tfp pilus assembly protein PilF